MKSIAKSALRGFMFVVTLGCYRGSTTRDAMVAPSTLPIGTYLGFVPTDESAVILGEIEFSITPKKINIRIATGLKIQTESLNSADFISMTTEEVAAEYKPGSEAVSSIVGFRSKNGTPKLLFVNQSANEEGPGLIVFSGGLSDIFGPSMFFSPSQIARGDFDRAVIEIESQVGKGALPRLKNKGRARK